jgi:hypothetical protein
MFSRCTSPRLTAPLSEYGLSSHRCAKHGLEMRLHSPVVPHADFPTSRARVLRPHTFNSTYNIVNRSVFGGGPLRSAPSIAHSCSGHRRYLSLTSVHRPAVEGCPDMASARYELVATHIQLNTQHRQRIVCKGIHRDPPLQSAVAAEDIIRCRPSGSSIGTFGSASSSEEERAELESSELNLKIFCVLEVSLQLRVSRELQKS